MYQADLPHLPSLLVMRPFFADRQTRPSGVRTGFHYLISLSVVLSAFLSHHHRLRELYIADFHKRLKKRASLG